MEEGGNESQTDNNYTIIGIPVYNSEETIASIILSCLEHADEVVCIDDCSSDKSAEFNLYEQNAL